jgi:hypothetical protein
MPTHHPTSLVLWKALQEIGQYPQGVIPVPEERLQGTGFFPGGDGLWKEDTADPLWPQHGVMVVGHDFHSEYHFAVSQQHNKENISIPTWRGLLGILRAVEISPQQCFFTNFYMGLRVGKACTGKFPGAHDGDFVARCRTFFLTQLSLLQPRLLLTLGAYIPSLIAPLSEELGAWCCAKTLQDIDRLGPVQKNVSFLLKDQSPETVRSIVCTTVVALTHPSLRAVNVRSRRFHEKSGHEAELAMLRAAKESLVLSKK